MLNEKNTTDVGVVIARFQTPDLHNGHIEIINTVLTKHSRVIIFLGLSPLKCTVNNPYQFVIRKKMFEEIYPSDKYPNIDIQYIDDVGDDEIWSKNLDKLVAKNIGPLHTATLYGSRDSFIKSYKGRYPTCELVPTQMISASNIRRQISLNPEHNSSFRKGMVYMAYNQYPTFHPCIDAAIIDFNKSMVLLAKKANDKKLRFIGGFMDVHLDKSAEDTVKREVNEETGLDVNNLIYIGSSLIPDWRYKYEQNKIMSMFYAAEYTGGIAIAKDDIEYVIWKYIKDLTKEDFISDHYPLYNLFSTWYNKNYFVSVNKQ